MNSKGVFLDLTNQMWRRRSQAWVPPRPNPSMTDVISSVVKSLQGHNLKRNRTHVVLLSPAAHILHKISKEFPDLFVHQVNPAVLPYRRESAPQDTVCFEPCCRNIDANSPTSYQSLANRIKQILKDARCSRPIGELSSLSIDVRARDGCELIEFIGSKDVSHLRLGQVHTVFVRIRVDRSKTQAVDLDSVNPIFKSSLEATGLRRELQNDLVVGAIKAHLLDVQLYYQNSINPIDCWNYTEAPFIIIREMGRYRLETNDILDFYKRQYYHKFSQLTPKEAMSQLNPLFAARYTKDEKSRLFIERNYRELYWQAETHGYERSSRQKLPLCPGPIDLEGPHEWSQDDLWNMGDEHTGTTTAEGGVNELVSSLERLT
jgi:hypothetical protein